MNIITPIDFPDWAAPIVVIKKPDGNVRICADYSTRLNEALEAKLAGERVFSIINLSDAYLQVEVDDDSKKLLMTADLEQVDVFLDDFIVHSEHYIYNVSCTLQEIS